VIEMTLAQIAAVTGATVVGDSGTGHGGVGGAGVTVTGTVEFDSRRVGPGGLFVAFAGAMADGHDFAAAAVQAGAVAVLGTRAVGAAPTILVEDCLAAMGMLARDLLRQLPRTSVIAVTGSSGKTSTKDCLAQLLGRLGPVVAPAGSFNNELGLPHTVLRADAATRFLVLEMGARGPGHLRYLCQVAPPQVAVVLNVGVAHIGEFGSVQAIAAAKAELVQALPATGTAVLNADDPRVRAMAALTAARVVLVGEAADAAVRAVDVELDERGRARFRLVTSDGEAPVRLALTGRHHVGNVLAVAAVAQAHGMALSDLAAALGELRVISSRRMDVFDRPDGVTVIDDSYNANPASTAAALQALVALGEGRRTLAVLGYLAELGEHERSGHEQVGRLAAELGVRHIVVVGAGASPIHDAAQEAVGWEGESVAVIDQEAAVAWLRAHLCPGDVVLVKGSRYRTWDIADALRGDHGLSADALRGDHGLSASVGRGDHGVVPDDEPGLTRLGAAAAEEAVAP
jgi:UDP-N-acetylmuramoyl-tripeptide--D-alanyl-D-alanine ligase